jgi:hypothetical protein
MVFLVSSGVPGWLNDFIYVDFKKIAVKHTKIAYEIEEKRKGEKWLLGFGHIFGGCYWVNDKVNNYQRACNTNEVSFLPFITELFLEVLAKQAKPLSNLLQSR